MTWVKLDDNVPDHPKMIAVGPLGFALWVAGLAYCNRHETDGRIPYEAVETLLRWTWTGPNGEVWTAAMTCGMQGEDVTPHAIAAMLVDAGLWRVVSRKSNAGFRVTNYEKYQPSHADLEKQRDQNRLRQQRFRSKPSRRDTPVTNAVTSPLVTGTPSRPENPTPTEGFQGRDRSEESGDAARSPSNGAAPLIDRMKTFVRREWDNYYPDLAVLRDELTDRGLTPDQAKSLIQREQANRR